jgi:hypothetical protein
VKQRDKGGPGQLRISTIVTGAARDEVRLIGV